MAKKEVIHCEGCGTMLGIMKSSDFLKVIGELEVIFLCPKCNETTWTKLVSYETKKRTKE